MRLEKLHQASGYFLQADPLFGYWWERRQDVLLFMLLIDQISFLPPVSLMTRVVSRWCRWHGSWAAGAPRLDLGMADSLSGPAGVLWAPYSEAVLQKVFQICLWLLLSLWSLAFLLTALSQPGDTLSPILCP